MMALAHPGPQGEANAQIDPGRAAACSITGVAHAAAMPQTAADKQVSIPFVDFGGVQD
jgi:hypothetical protein